MRDGRGQNEFTCKHVEFEMHLGHLRSSQKTKALGAKIWRESLRVMEKAREFVLLRKCAEWE